MKLHEAKTYDDIADVLARRCWWNRHGNSDKGRNCPDDMIPTPRDLAEFIENSGGHQDLLLANNDEMERSIGFAMYMMRHFMGMAGVGLHYMEGDNEGMSALAIKETIERFHARWLTWETTRANANAKAELRRHPMGRVSEMQAAGGRHESTKMEPMPHYAQTLIDLWQRSPKNVLPFMPVTKASLPRFNRIDRESTMELPAFDTDANSKSDEGQLELLPLGGLDESAVSWLLRLYNEVGGDIMRKGKGAPYELRLFIGALLHLHIAQRDGQIWRIDVPTDKVIEWLHPNGWGNKRRDWHRLPEALMAIRSRLNAISIKGVGSVQLMTVSVIPEQSTDPWVRFALMVPMRAAKGVRINWRQLCEYGTQNAPVYCAYLSAAVAMDESARKGTLITKDIHPPIEDAHGRQKRHRGGKVVRDTKRLVPNRAAQFVRVYSKDDLTRMAGMDPKDHNHRFRAMEAFNRLHDDGVIDLQRDGGNWRIFGPRGDARRVSL